MRVLREASRANRQWYNFWERVVLLVYDSVRS